jgi:CheY-like chemotaxis protein
MPSILVIDDQPAVRRLITRILAGEGHRTTEAEGGTEGIAAFKREGAALVIKDMVMEEGEGIETIRELRRLAPELPVAGLSTCALRPTWAHQPSLKNRSPRPHVWRA